MPTYAFHLFSVEIRATFRLISYWKMLSIAAIHGLRYSAVCRLDQLGERAAW